MKRKILYSILLLAVSILTGTVGVIYGYAVLGLTHSNNEVVKMESKNLHIQALRVSKLPSSSNKDDLIELLISNGEDAVSFISANKPYCSEATRRSISEAMEKWSEARQKLEGLKSTSDILGG